MLRLLIDTSAWLDLAMRRDGQKWIVPLRGFLRQGKLELLVPPLVIEEFERNRPRSVAAVTKSALTRLRQLRRELHEFAGEKHEHVWLEETEQHIPLVNAMAPQNFREIAELLIKGTRLKATNADRARVVQRGLEKKAPFSTGKNSVADALLIGMYVTQLKTDRRQRAYVFRPTVMMRDRLARGEALSVFELIKSMIRVRTLMITSEAQHSRMGWKQHADAFFFMSATILTFL